MKSNHRVTVFGAYGHTGRFVVAELRAQGWTPILSGRDQKRLESVSEAHDGLEVRVADVNDRKSLEAAVSGSEAVINCAGPFLDTAAPIAEVAIRSGIHYLDIAAEQSAVLDLFERFDRPARAAGVVVAPALAFYGGLGDLMSTATMGDWDEADEINIAIALDSWKPTRGTRLTGERNQGPRHFFTKNKLERGDPPPGRNWDFFAPFGEQPVTALALAETITISRHLRTPQIRMYLNLTPLADLRDPNTPEPTASDASGRSSQIFVMDVRVRKRTAERMLVAHGRDIYAITAPIVVEAARRIIDGPVRRTGAVAAGEAFDAADFLASLAPAGLTIDRY
jgi:saccharopine dehydrogenase-like NADP-dependent oxidoreductase